MAAALYIDFTGLPESQRNYIWLLFRHPAVRRLQVDWQEAGALSWPHSAWSPRRIPMTLSSPPSLGSFRYRTPTSVLGGRPSTSQPPATAPSTSATPSSVISR